jgi:hypothetical protein
MKGLERGGGSGGESGGRVSISSLLFPVGNKRPVGNVASHPVALRTVRQRVVATPVAGGVLPPPKTFKNIAEFIEFLHKPPPRDDSGLSIVDREWRWKEAGLAEQDIRWRMNSEGDRRRIFDFKRPYERVQARKTEEGNTITRLFPPLVQPHLRWRT